MANRQLVPVDGKGLDWPRKVAAAATKAANDIDALQTASANRLQHPFEELAAPPPSPTEGQTYYDTTTHKVRTWNGTAWMDHW